MNTFVKPFFKDLAGVLVLVVFSCGLGIWVRTPCAGSPDLQSGIAHPAFSLDQFRTYVQGKETLILDARNTANYREGHVPGARSLPVANFDEAFARMSNLLQSRRDKLMIVYCSDMWCGQADMLQQKLVNFGFKHVGVFPDGWNAWVSAGLPVEKENE